MKLTLQYEMVCHEKLYAQALHLFQLLNQGVIGWASDCETHVVEITFAGFVSSYRQTRMQIKADFYFRIIECKQAYGYIMALFFFSKLLL